MSHDDEAELALASAALGLACRQIMNLTLETRDAESIAALVHTMDILIDEIRTTFARNAEVVAVADALKIGLREVLWAEAGCTLQ